MATYKDPVTGGTYTTGAGGKTTGGSAAAGGGINPATGKYEGGDNDNNDRRYQPLAKTSQMSLETARAKADKAFSGLVAPMTLDEIRGRETTAKGLTAQTAEAVYDPAISRQKQTGAAQVSTTKGVVGQRQGFNISTAEQAYVADVQNKVQDRIQEVENNKASYIAQGNLAAADRADSQIQDLNEWNSQMTIAKAQYALQIMSGSREQAGLELQRAKFGLDKKAQEFSEGMANENLAISIAGMTGTYTNPTTGEVNSTLASKQADINNAIAEANLTGFYKDEETVQGEAQRLQSALNERGMVVSERQIDEMIRSNYAQEGLAAARLNNQNQGTSDPEGALDYSNLDFNQAKEKAAQHMADMGLDLDSSTWTLTLNNLAEEYKLPIQNVTDAAGNKFDKVMVDLKTDMENLTRSKRGDDEESENPLFGPNVEPAESLFGGGTYTPSGGPFFPYAPPKF